MKKRIFKWNRYIGMSFLFPFLIMVAILITRNVYPFGDESILHMDMYHQYAPFFAEFLHKLRNGESLFYSWNVGLGSNFLALFAYYLASPLNWLVVLFPEKYLLEFMTAMIVVKTALCGVTFYLYLRYHFKKENLAMVLCSCFYALSGFMAAYNWDIMWLDNVILAPLIILGLEKLFYEKKYFLYVVTLGISILSDYYLSIMICMFVVLWFVMLLLQEPKRQKQCIPFAGYSLLAGGLGAILLLPTYFALHFTDFGKFNFPKEITSYFSIFDMLARHFMNVATEQRLDHWPNIYCGVAVLILVPLFVLNKKVDLKEKLLKLGMMLFFLMSFTVNVLVFIWHGFNYPDSLPARQSFLYIFLVLVICYESFDKLDGVSLKALGGSFAGAFLFLLLCEKLYGYQSDFTLDSYYLTGLFLILYGVLLYVYMRYKQDTSWARYARFGKLFAVAAVCVVVLETEINMEDTSLTTTSRSSYLEDLESYENLVESVKESDPGFYRFEKWKRVTKNDGTLAGYPMASVFSSTVNSHVGDLYEQWGMGHSKVFYCFDGATPLTAALLNVKYMFSDTMIQDAGGLYALLDEEEGIYLYECQAALPFGYVVPEGFVIPQKTEEKDNMPFETQNAMVAGMLEGQPLFVPTGISHGGQTIQAEITEAGYYFAYPQSKKIKNVTLSVNGTETEYKKMGNGFIIPIGYVEAGSQVFLSSKDSSEPNMVVYRMETDKLMTVIQSLQEQTMTVEEYDSDSLQGTIVMKKAGELVFSIPYEPGWTLKVDGVKTEANRYGNALISVALTEGAHTIELSYFPQGFLGGAVISGLSLLILVLIIFYKRRHTKE